MLKILHDFTEYLKTVNIYVVQDEDPPRIRRQQLLATRLFIVLFLLALISLVGYESSILQLTNVQIKHPSQATFEQLYPEFHETLNCPCSQTSIPIKNFSNVYFSYHQICSSIFVTDEFISSVSNTNPIMYYSLDARRMISSQLQLLASQCRASQMALTDELTILEVDQFFIPKMISSDSLKSQINIIVNQAIKLYMTRQNEYRQFLVRIVLKQNLIFSGLSNNIFAMNINGTNQAYYLVKYLTNWTYPPRLGYTNYTDSQLCYCIDTSNCTYPSGIYPNLTGVDSYRYYGTVVPPVISETQIQGLHTGCMPFDAISYSTLECFYDKNCLLKLFDQQDVQPLSTEISSSYPIDAKIDTLIEGLFIENMLIETNFDLFYAECQPTKCLYSYNSKGNFAFIILTIISLIGGLLVALKLISNFVIDFYLKIRKRYCTKSSDDQNSSDDTSSNKSKFSVKKLLKKIWDFIVNYNLFDNPYADEYEQRSDILATRVYVSLMAIGLMAIVFYAAIAQHSLTYYVESPSIDTYNELVNQYPSLVCECQQQTSNYSTFVSFAPTFHQICSSVYALNAFSIHFGNTNGAYSLGGFTYPVSVTSIFYAIRAMCGIGEAIISESITTYLETVYFSTYLTHETNFMSSINVSVNSLKTSLPAAATQLLQLLQNTIHGNQLLSSTFSNAKIQYNSSAVDEEDKIHLLWSNSFNASCKCGLSLDSCALLYDDYCNNTYSHTFTANCAYPAVGLYIACYLFDANLYTTMQCLFDIDCVSTIKYDFLNSSNSIFSAIPLFLLLLNANALSRYSTNATVYEIISNYGLEQWNEKINYELYYNNCNPIDCFYTITKTLYLPTIVTTVLGLIGGLSVILKILVPLIVKFIRNYNRMEPAYVTTYFQESWLRRLIKKIYKINLFHNNETKDNATVHYNQIIATRLYIILWIICVILLSIHIGLSENKSSFELNSLSMTVINQYQSKNLDEFTCPCTKIVIPFQTFTLFNYSLHQICSSKFISNDWLEGLFDLTNEHKVSEAIFAQHFKILQLFCQSANYSINLLTEKEFVEQTTSSLEQLQYTIINAYKENLNVTIDTILGSQLISIYETNWYLFPDPNGSNIFHTKSRSYNNCSCGTSQASNCIDLLVLNNNLTVDGMFIGCLPITSLLLSSLECFYNQTCLDRIKQTLNLQNISINSLNSSQSSQYSINTTLNKIIPNLMLENWTYEINYTEYFNTCNVQKCTYSVLERNNALLIFTTLLGLYGGLTMTLRFLAPIIVKIAGYMKNNCRQNRQTVPEPFHNK